MDAPINNWKSLEEFVGELSTRVTNTQPAVKRVSALHVMYYALVCRFKEAMDKSYNPTPYDNASSTKVRDFLNLGSRKIYVFNNFNLSDYSRFIEGIRKTRLIAEDILLKDHVDTITVSGNTSDLAILLRQHNMTPAQYILRCLREDVLDSNHLNSLFKFYPVTLDPSRLSGKDFVKLEQAGIDLNSRENFDPLPVISALKERDEDLFHLLLAYGVNLGVLFRPENWEFTCTTLIHIRPSINTIDDAVPYLLKITEKPCNTCIFEDHLCYVLLNQTNRFNEYLPSLLSKGFTIDHAHGNETILSTLLKNPPVYVYEKVKFLIENGAPVDTPNNTGLTLKRAMEHGLWDVAKLLVKKGANPNHTTMKGQNLVAYALETGDTQFMAELCELKVDFSKLRGPKNALNLLTDEHGPVALDWAILNRSPCLELLLNHLGRFIGIMHSSIHCAFKTKQYELMDKLYEHGAPSHICYNDEGQTPLTLLFFKGDLVAFEAALTRQNQKNGVKFRIDHVNGNGQTCFLTLLKEPPSPRNEEFIRIALNFSPNWHKKNSKGETPLHYALKYYPYLLHDIDIDFSAILELDASGQCPMDVAFIYQRAEFIKKCLSRFDLDLGVPVDEIQDCSKAGLCALLHTSVRNNPDAIQQCLHVALLFNLAQFTIDMQRVIPQDQFVTLFTDILSEFPFIGESYYLNHLIVMNPNHLAVEPIGTQIPEAPADVDYQELCRLIMDFKVSPEVLTKGTQKTVAEFYDGVKKFFMHLELSLDQEKVNELTIKLQQMSTSPIFTEKKKEEGKRRRSNDIVVYTAREFKEKLILYFENAQSQFSTHSGEKKSKLKDLLIVEKNRLAQLYKQLKLIFDDIEIPLTAAQILQVNSGISVDPELSFTAWQNLFHAKFAFFQKIDSKPDPSDPYNSKKRIIKYLDPGFFPEIINNLKHLKLAYEKHFENSAFDQCETLLLEIGLIANECSNRWKTGTHEQYRIHCAQIPNVDLGMYLVYRFNELRLEIAKVLAGGESHAVTRAYSILANNVKLWGAQAFIHHNDFVDKDVNEGELLQKFVNFYNPGFLCEQGQTMLKEHMQAEAATLFENIELSVLTWFAQNMPDCPRDDLFFRSEGYLLKLENVICLLVAHGIINEVQPETSAKVMRKLNDKFDQEASHYDKKSRTSPNE